QHVLTRDVVDAIRPCTNVVRHSHIPLHERINDIHVTVDSFIPRYRVERRLHQPEERREACHDNSYTGGVSEMVTEAAPLIAAIAAATNAVVAICVVFVPGAAVGAVGTPVSGGDASNAYGASNVVNPAPDTVPTTV